MKEMTWKTGYWDFSWEELHECRQSEEGVCMFDPQDGAELEIPFGDLSETPKLNKTGVCFSGLKNERYDHLFGLTQDGTWLVLCDALSMGVGRSCPGGSRERLKASTVLEARHEFCPDSPIVGMDIEFDGMRDWLDARYLPKHEGDVVLIDFGDSERIIPVASSSEYSIDLRVGVTGARESSQGVDVPLHCFFRIAFHEGRRDLDSIWRGEVWRLQSMLAFCFGHCPSVLWAKVRFAGDDRQVRVYRSSAFLDSPRRLSKHPPIAFHQMGEVGFSRFAESWMALEGDRWNAARTLVSLLDEWKMPLSLQLLAATTMLESLARSVTEDPFTSEGLKPLVDPLVEAADERIRERAPGLLNMLRFPSYGMLLESVFEHSGKWGERLIPHWKRFKDEQYNLRIAVAHGRDAGEEHRLMVNHYYAQIALAYYVLMKELGFSERTIDAFEQSTFLNVARERIAKEYARRG